MNRRFRLATVQRLRSDALTDAGRALQAASRQLAAEQQRRAELETALQSAYLPGNGSAAEIQQAAHRRDWLRAELAQAGSRVVAAETEVDGARAGWLQARAQLRAVEALHERHRLAVHADDARREQRELDDRAGRQHAAGRQRAAGRQHGAGDRAGIGGRR